VLGHGGMVGEIPDLQQVAAHETGPPGLLERGPGGLVGVAAAGGPGGGCSTTVSLLSGRQRGLTSDAARSRRRLDAAINGWGR
jgi:hypothetical protein